MKSPERMSASPSRELGRPRRRPSAALVLLALPTLLSLFAGCATIPEYEPADLLSYLPGNHNGYVSVAPSEEPFFSETLLQAFGFEATEAERIAKRTERAFLGLGPEQEFSLVALGRYPDRAVARNLRRHGWEEGEDAAGSMSWTNPAASFRIVRLRADTYLITTTDEARSIPPVRLSEGAHRRFLSASMGFYAPEPGRSMLAGLAGRGELPIEEVYVEFLRATEEERREVVARVTTRSEEDARTLLVITRLLVIGTLNAGGIAFDEIPESLTVEREGAVILLDGLLLREGQIARLFLERVPASEEEALP